MPQLRSPSKHRPVALRRRSQQAAHRVQASQRLMTQEVAAVLQEVWEQPQDRQETQGKKAAL
jgi:hypothetical protein